MAPMELTDVQLRILGCLVEKAATTPDNYPLSTNALVNACNQSTNRDPIVAYSDLTVDAAMLELRTAGLARTVTGGRANKHKHVLDEAWELPDGALSLLAVLFLRGPQTAGELRGRTERLYGFESVGDVEGLLEQLASSEPAWVTHLERRPGQKEGRWAHLLGASAATEWAEPAAVPPASVPGSPPATTLPATPAAPGGAATLAGLERRVERLRADVDQLYSLLGETPVGDD